MDLEDKTLAEFAENDLRELWDTDFYAEAMKAASEVDLIGLLEGNTTGGGTCSSSSCSAAPPGGGVVIQDRLITEASLGVISQLSLGSLSSLIAAHHTPVPNTPVPNVPVPNTPAPNTPDPNTSSLPVPSLLPSEKLKSTSSSSCSPHCPPAPQKGIKREHSYSLSSSGTCNSSNENSADEQDIENECFPAVPITQVETTVKIVPCRLPEDPSSCSASPTETTAVQTPKPLPSTNINTDFCSSFKAIIGDSPLWSTSNDHNALLTMKHEDIDCKDDNTDDENMDSDDDSSDDDDKHFDDDVLLANQPWDSKDPLDLTDLLSDSSPVPDMFSVVEVASTDNSASNKANDNTTEGCLVRFMGGGRPSDCPRVGGAVIHTVGRADVEACDKYKEDRRSSPALPLRPRLSLPSPTFSTLQTIKCSPVTAARPAASLDVSRLLPTAGDENHDRHGLMLSRATEASTAEHRRSQATALARASHENGFSLPPTPPSYSSSDSECSGSSPPRTPPLYETLIPQLCSPRRPTNRHSTSVRHPIHTPLISSQPKGATGVLMLTEEEKRTLVSEGYPIPTKLPLTKAEEKSLKKIRRKIKNKISAQESRRKKKEYMDHLERKVDDLAEQNKAYRRRLDALSSANVRLTSELQALKEVVARQEKHTTRSTVMASIL